MKFLEKINRNYLIPFSLVLIVVTFAGYFLLRNIIISQAKERLISKEYLVEEQIKKGGELPNLPPVLEVQKSDREPEVDSLIRNVTIRNEKEQEDELFLEYSVKRNIAGSWYIIKLRQSSFENEDLIIILAIAVFILLTSAFFILYLSARRMNRTVWSAFERNLREIENYSFRAGCDISLVNSDIEEFKRLNSVITDFINKLKTDYTTLKVFTENASHELQTPLSAALMHLEEILQKDINEDVFQRVVMVMNSLKRLTALNQNLLLLAKIENMQFEAGSDIILNEVFLRKIKEFTPVFDEKKLELDVQSEGNFVIRMNEYLSEILVSNLLSNAVRHNREEGMIRIVIRPDFLYICNTGQENSLTNETIFNRFVSGNPKTAGLGLEIVRKICEIHNLHISYSKNSLHCFTITKLKPGT